MKTISAIFFNDVQVNEVFSRDGNLYRKYARRSAIRVADGKVCFFKTAMIVEVER